MMHGHMSVAGIMSKIVPITRFNKGEANKIFDEVKQTGTKVVLKNNDPVCVLMTPEAYEAMVETLADYEIAMEAERRLETGGSLYPMDMVMDELGITHEALADIEVDIE